jgi:hypothetical protein
MKYMKSLKPSAILLMFLLTSTMAFAWHCYNLVEVGKCGTELTPTCGGEFSCVGVSCPTDYDCRVLSYQQQGYTHCEDDNVQWCISRKYTQTWVFGICVCVEPSVPWLTPPGYGGFCNVAYIPGHAQSCSE